MQFRFVSIEKLPEPPQIHLVKGNFVHRVLELLLANDSELRTPEAALKAFEVTKSQYESSVRFIALGLSDDARDAFFNDSREILNKKYVRTQESVCGTIIKPYAGRCSQPCSIA